MDKYFKYILHDINYLTVRCDHCTMLNSFYNEYAPTYCIHCNTDLDLVKVTNCIKYKDYINFKGY